MSKMEYQPKTGEKCHCKPGVIRDNCPECEGTGMKIDFAKIRARSIPEQHQLKIARRTLELNGAIAGVLGGPTQSEAREIIRRNHVIDRQQNRLRKRKL